MAVDLVRLTTVGLAILAIASLFVSRRDIAEAWRPGQRLQAATAQVLVTGGMLTEATFVQNRVVVQMAVVAALVAILVFAEITDVRTQGHLHHHDAASLIFNRTPTLLILMLWVWLFGVNLWSAVDQQSNNAFYRPASGVALLLFLITQRYRPVTLLHFYSAALTTLSAIMVTIPFTSDYATSCSRFKCNEIGALLHGPFASENSLGFAAAMCTVLYIVAVPRSRSAVVILAFLVATIYATYSRTSLLALGVALALGGIQFLLFPARATAKTPTRLIANGAAACCAVIPMIVGMILVYHSDFRDFSDRGRIWMLGRAAADQFPVAGQGLDSWSDLTKSGYFGKNFSLYPHSEYLLLYFSGGAIALILFALLIYRITYVAIIGQQSLARGVTLPVFFVTAGITETIWNPLSVDQGTWIFFALVAACVLPGQHVARAQVGPPARLAAEAPSPM
jgi:hypothetical protein